MLSVTRYTKETIFRLVIIENAFAMNTKIIPKTLFLRTSRRIFYEFKTGDVIKWHSDKYTKAYKITYKKGYERLITFCTVHIRYHYHVNNNTAKEWYTGVQRLEHSLLLFFIFIF